MNIKEVEALEVYTPKQVSEMLDITSPTLRKYCSLISTEHGSEYFRRSDTNARLYTPEDLKLLKRIKTLKKSPSVTLENAVSIALKEFRKETDVATITPIETSARYALSTNTQVLQTLLDVVRKQSDDIAALVATNQQLHEDVQSLVSVNEKLSADMQGLLASLRGALNEPATDQAETKPKTSLFKRFFG